MQNVYHLYNKQTRQLNSKHYARFQSTVKSLRITEVITTEDCYTAVMLAGNISCRIILFLINHSCIHQAIPNLIRDLCFTCCRQFSPSCFLNGKSACNSDFVIDLLLQRCNIAVPNLKMLLRVIQVYFGNCFKRQSIVLCLHNFQGFPFHAHEKGEYDE